MKLKTTGGTLRVDGQSASGPFVHELRVGGAETQTGTPALAALYARECVEDLELRRAAGEGSPVLDRQVETFGLAFQISTRLTSWVAVSAQTTVDPLAPKRQQTVPHQLAQGLSAEGVGLRAAAAPVMNAFGAVAAAPVVGAAAKMMKRMPAPRASTAGAPPPPARARAFDASADKADHAPMKEKAERAPAAPEPQFDEGQARAEEDAFDASTEAEAIEPPVAKGGLLQRVRGFFTPAPGGSGGAPAIPGTPSRVLPGRIVVNREGRLALEVAIEGMALEWQVPGEVRLMLASGAVMSVKVNTSLTTRSGTLSPGVSLTLTLDLPKAVSDVRSVMLNVGGEWLEIAVHD